MQKRAEDHTGEGDDDRAARHVTVEQRQDAEHGKSAGATHQAPEHSFGQTELHGRRLARRVYAC